jgi:hypothetical protein
LLDREQDGELKFAGPAILRPSDARAEWADKFAAISIDKLALKGLSRGRAQWLKPEFSGQVPASQGQGHASACDG